MKLIKMPPFPFSVPVPPPQKIQWDPPVPVPTSVKYGGAFLFDGSYSTNYDPMTPLPPLQMGEHDLRPSAVVQGEAPEVLHPAMLPKMTVLPSEDAAMGLTLKQASILPFFH